MCGRFTLTSSPAELRAYFDLGEVDPFPPRYNIAPTQPVLIVIEAAGAPARTPGRGRVAILARWGLIPAWTRDPAHIPLLFNARSESAAERNAFRGAMRYRRCLVPASGFYEWQRRPGRTGKPFFVRPPDRSLVAFAGLMETYLAPDGSEIDTLAILTTAANATLAPIHERMPAVIGPEAFDRWLDCRAVSPAAVADLLVPASDGLFEPVPISDAVNRTSSADPRIQDRVEPEEDEPGEESSQGRLDL